MWYNGTMGKVQVRLDRINDRIDAVDAKVKAMQDERTWLIRIILATIVVAGMGLLLIEQ